MAYGQILSQEVIEHGAHGLHQRPCSPAAALTAGAACIQSALSPAIPRRESPSCTSSKSWDADIIAQISTPLEGTETGGSLHDKLAQMTPDVLLPAIHAIEKGTATRVPQKEFPRRLPQAPACGRVFDRGRAPQRKSDA